MQLILQTYLPDEAGSCKAGVRLQVFTLNRNEKKKQSKKVQWKNTHVCHTGRLAFART